MNMRRLLVGSLLTAAPAVALAQLDAPVRHTADPTIVVTGQRLTPDGKRIAMSDWRVAETQHVLFYARASDKQVARVARNLERLHFLLSILLNRIDKPDDTIKLSVTQIGDIADFNNLHLGNARWQQGPFPKAFPPEFYYDPRDDGPVMATTRTDQQIVLQQGRIWGLGTNLGVGGSTPDTGAMGVAPSLAETTASPQMYMINAEVYASSAEGRLYSGFAQHFLQTYFPAAYPRWYLDGFGEMFSTLVADKDGEIAYGLAPDGYRRVVEHFGRYPIADLLAGRYLNDKPSRTGWTPYHAWSLVHLLFFSEEWRRPLHDYLKAVAEGAEPAEAAKAFGDLAKLQKQWGAYRYATIPYEKLSYPAGKFGDPLVRQLSVDQTDFVKRRLVLGARVTIPSPKFAGDDRPDKALKARAQWLDQLGQEAKSASNRVEFQLLWAEGACRSEAWSECATAADRALALAPQSSAALGWKGLALVGTAANLPAPQRDSQIAEARAAIASANRGDTEAVLPLLAYYRSFRDAGSPPPDLAVLGLVKAGMAVPAASSTRLMLGDALAMRGDLTEARQILLPVAIGAYDTPERAAAASIVAHIDLQGSNAMPPQTPQPAP